MSNTELIILLAAVFVWGAFSGILIYQVLVVDPLRREANDMRRAARRAIASGNRLADAVHRGTPYRPETVAAAHHPQPPQDIPSDVSYGTVPRLPRDDEWSKKVPARLEVI